MTIGLSAARDVRRRRRHTADGSVLLAFHVRRRQPRGTAPDVPLMGRRAGRRASRSGITRSGSLGRSLGVQMDPDNVRSRAANCGRRCIAQRRQLKLPISGPSDTAHLPIRFKAASKVCHAGPAGGRSINFSHCLAILNIDLTSHSQYARIASTSSSLASPMNAFCSSSRMFI